MAVRNYPPPLSLSSIREKTSLSFLQLNNSSMEDAFLKEFYIPIYILNTDAQHETLPNLPECPVIVFINSKSGHQLGRNLLLTYRSLLNENQGAYNPVTDHQSVKSFLHQVMKAKEMKIDNWHILMRMRTPKEPNCDPVAPLDQLPHSLHSFERVSGSDSSNMEGYLTFRGGFWNYFSMGMDAQVSYAFHSEKNLYPDKFKNQLVNQTTYARLGCTQGWFLASLLHPADKNIEQLASVKVMRKQANEWEELHIPHSIKSIVCLNLPSFSGGLNPWGTPNKNETRNSGFTPPCVDDGLIEVVGFRDVWHGLVLLAPSGHGTRLAQANRVRFEFRKGATDHTFMRIDGEPWNQPLPVDDDTVVMEISHHGQVHMLATDCCRSRSIQDPSSMDYSGSLEDDKDGDPVAEGEKWRKFGAADILRIPDEVDISHLS